VQYYNEDNALITAPPGSPLTAEKVTLTLTLGKSVYGEDITVVTSITMKKING
jgi:hypothetical protein